MSICLISYFLVGQLVSKLVRSNFLVVLFENTQKKRSNEQRKTRYPCTTKEKRIITFIFKKS